MEEIFGHIDCNNFYSLPACVRADLEGVPVIVLSNNDGCAVARSLDYVESGQLASVSRHIVTAALPRVGRALKKTAVSFVRSVDRLRILGLWRLELGRGESLHLASSDWMWRLGG
jgi:hypothetical protein